MTTDFRALCAELTEKLHEQTSLYDGHEIALVQRARTQLAQPEGERLTDEELLAVLDKATADFPPLHPEAEALNAVEYPLALELRKARAAIAADRACRATPQPPADGEVEELVEGLKLISDGMSAMDHESDSWFVARAAELLQRQHPQPVPVAERLPGPEDCDAQGRCWLLTVEDEYPQWRLHSIEGAQPGGAMIWVPVDSSPGVMVDCFYTSHWLPFHALPIPASQEAGE